MICPFSFTLIAPESINIVAQRLNKLLPYSSNTVLSPAILAASIGLKSFKDVLDTEGYELGHFNVSFYIETFEIASILVLSNAKCLQLDSDAFIVTHDILGWKDMIVKGLTKTTPKETRRIMSVVFAYMRDNGFASLFSEYRRCILPLDGTMFLERE